VEVHLLFPFQMPLGEAHEKATVIEDEIERMFEEAVEVTTHLEAVEDHGAVHKIRANHCR
jgi:divalent metal cation (Fe/Co/Zn/Cd) transporter